MTERNERNILWSDELNRSDVELVGGKSSSLGELTSQVKVPIPLWLCHNSPRLPSFHGC